MNLNIQIKSFLLIAVSILGISGAKAANLVDYQEKEVKDGREYCHCIVIDPDGTTFTYLPPRITEFGCKNN